MSIVKAALLAAATKIALGTAMLSLAAALAPSMAHAQLLSPQWPQEQRDRFLALGKAQWSRDQTCNTMITFTKTLEADAFFASFNGVPARVEMANDFAAWKRDDARGLDAKHPSSVFNWSICKGNQTTPTIFGLPPSATIPAAASAPLPAAIPIALGVPTNLVPVTSVPKTVKTAEIALGGTRQDRHLWASFNGVGPYDFMLDTGASSCTMPQNIFNDLMSRGTISSRDYAGAANFTIADGSTHAESLYRINKLVIGGAGASGWASVSNLVCAIAPAGSPALLGMDFLGIFDSFAIDNAHDKLIVNWTN